MATPNATPSVDNGRKLSLRLQLSLLVMATLLPLIIFAVGLVYVYHQHDRDAAFDRVLETVRGIRLVMDAEVSNVTAGLQVLALSPVQVAA